MTGSSHTVDGIVHVESVSGNKNTFEVRDKGFVTHDDKLSVLSNGCNS